MRFWDFFGIMQITWVIPPLPRGPSRATPPPPLDPVQRPMIPTAPGALAEVGGDGPQTAAEAHEGEKDPEDPEHREHERGRPRGPEWRESPENYPPPTPKNKGTQTENTTKTNNGEIKFHEYEIAFKLKIQGG